MTRGALLLAALFACKSSAPTPTTVTTGPDPAQQVPEPAPPPEKLEPIEPAKPAADVQLLADCRDQLAKAKEQHAAIATDTLEHLNELGRFITNVSSIGSLFSEVHPDAKVREAARTCEQEAAAMWTAVLIDKTVYDAIKAVDIKAADANTKRFVEVILRDFKRAGILLPDKDRLRVKEIDDEITKVGQQLSKNIAEDTKYVEVNDPKRLTGLPADWIAAHPAVNGVIKISTDYPDYVPVMTYADDDTLRKELYIKFRQRGEAGNEAVIKQMLTLRAEKAKLLGFKNWADYQSDDKMLRGGNAAQKFIDRVAALGKPRMRRDYNELLARLKKIDPKAKAVGDWQAGYLDDKVKKESYAVDSTVVRSYFPFAPTLAGLLDITSKIYDVQYQQVTDPRTWHGDVKVFDVMRKGDKLGRIFLDLHPRDDKYKHAAQFTLLSGITGKQLPEGVLVCNFNQPKGDSKGLMEHGEVVTMFHEFGHLMHHVLGGNQKWFNQSGVATEHDFVEAPSQMFEEWGWSHSTLSLFAKHAETGAVIPEDLVTKMRKARKFGVGRWSAQQMFYAALALEYHRADPAKLDQLATLKRLQKKYTPFAYVEGTKFHTSFGHLAGYSSMYYTYMWSFVIAKDILTPFEKHGLMTTEQTYKYRDKILAAGGTKPAADLVKDFLGRPYDFKAFERYLTTDQ
ncbi:MAG TPA: M3 family metallopeptidase [Kofleriaceae bacterium]